MKHEDIMEIIKKLKDSYLNELGRENYLTMVDIHDEIDRWNNMLNTKIKKDKKHYLLKGYSEKIINDMGGKNDKKQ